VLLSRDIMQALDRRADAAVLQGANGLGGYTIKTRLLWRRGGRALAACLLLGLLAVCRLGDVGGTARAIVLPSVLLRTNWIWVGDLCRATQSSTIMYAQPCTPGYTVDVVIYGRVPRHYMLFRLPRR
jgi:hypothetical protein